MNLSAFHPEVLLKGLVACFFSAASMIERARLQHTDMSSFGSWRVSTILLSTNVSREVVGPVPSDTHVNKLTEPTSRNSDLCPRRFFKDRAVS